MSLYTIRPAMPGDRFAEAIRYALRGNDPIPGDMTLGITGTREIPADPQTHALGLLVNTYMRVATGRKEMHHGCATGADESAHEIALTIPGILIHGHPGYGTGGRAPYRMAIRPGEFATLYPELPYRERNLAIVSATRLLLACPRYPEQDARSARSGTWQTIRFARRAQIPVIILTPTGGIIHDHTERHSL